MKVQYNSDIHTEFAHIEAVIDPTADVIIQAGDIGTGVSGLRWALEQFKEIPVIYVAGNHEGYGHDFAEIRVRLQEMSKGTNVTVLDDSSVTIDGVTFMGGTLWTDLTITGKSTPRIDRHIGAVAIRNGMNDQHRIRYGGKPFTAQHWLDMHYATREFLTEQFRTMTPDKTVVVTHHLPFPESIDARYEGQQANCGFASDMTPLLEIGMPKYWVHGHTHHPCEYTVGDTRVLCNPRGYENRRGSVENKEFLWTKTFEI